MKRLLIIDDSPFIAREILSIIDGHDYEIIGHAKSGEDGIKLFKELEPDVTTLDIIMPGIDGIETARELLKINPNAKIMMLSSLCDYDTLQEIQDIGLKYLVSKPIERGRFLEILSEIG